MRRTRGTTLETWPAAWPEPGTLRWRSVALPAGAPVDPFALAAGWDPGHPGFVLASDRSVVVGCGAAALLPLAGGLAGAESAAVRDWLAAVAPSGTAAVDHGARVGARPAGLAGPGCPAGPVGPVAAGALPFAPDAPGALVVPGLCYVRDGDEEWATVVAPEGTEDDRLENPAALRGALARPGGDVRTGAAEPLPRLVGIDESPGAGFAEAVRRALGAIGSGPVTKVVLARRVVASFDAPLDPVDVMHRLRAQEPTATVYGVLADGAAFVGASPELLVARHGDHVESWPLAGTAGLSGDERADAATEAALVSSPKERDEHAQVVDAIGAALAPFCEGPPQLSGPTVARLRSVVHLASCVTGTLSGDKDVLCLAQALHPTPAVAGSPTPEAIALLGALEPEGRGRYAGPVGWMDARGDGAFVVAIRGASLSGAKAALYAGAGIVAGSDPGRELAETTLKLRTALRALGATAER